MNKINKLILTALRDNPTNQIGEISKIINKPLSSLFYSLNNLLSRKEIIKTDYGKYEITEIGIKMLELEELRG